MRVSVSAVVLTTIAVGCAPKPTPAPVVVASPGCDLADRAWLQTSPGPCGASTWTFVKKPDGTYAGTESGCAGATGIARWDGKTVRLAFQVAASAGYYTWPLDTQCITRPGQVEWTSGLVDDQTALSTITPAP